MIGLNTEAVATNDKREQPPPLHPNHPNPQAWKSNNQPTDASSQIPNILLQLSQSQTQNPAVHGGGAEAGQATRATTIPPKVPGYATRQPPNCLLIPRSLTPAPTLALEILPRTTNHGKVYPQLRAPASSPRPRNCNKTPCGTSDHSPTRTRVRIPRFRASLRSYSQGMWNRREDIHRFPCRFREEYQGVTLLPCFQFGGRRVRAGGYNCCCSISYRARDCIVVHTSVEVGGECI